MHHISADHQKTASGCEWAALSQTRAAEEKKMVMRKLAEKVAARSNQTNKAYKGFQWHKNPWHMIECERGQ